MWSVIVQILARFIDADKLGGWVRALVAVVLGQAASWFGGVLAPFLTPELKLAIGSAIATLIVGLWSQIAKSVAKIPSQQVASLSRLPEVNNAKLANAVGPELAKSVPKA
jgi:hypothetical protein